MKQDLVSTNRKQYKPVIFTNKFAFIFIFFHMLVTTSSPKALPCHQANTPSSIFTMGENRGSLSFSSSTFYEHSSVYQQNVAHTMRQAQEKLMSHGIDISTINGEIFGHEPRCISCIAYTPHCMSSRSWTTSSYTTKRNCFYKNTPRKDTRQARDSALCARRFR
jgi:hypothetical protein